MRILQIKPDVNKVEYVHTINQSTKWTENVYQKDNDTLFILWKLLTGLY